MFKSLMTTFNDENALPDEDSEFLKETTPIILDSDLASEFDPNDESIFEFIENTNRAEQETDNKNRFTIEESSEDNDQDSNLNQTESTDKYNDILADNTLFKQDILDEDELFTKEPVDTGITKLFTGQKTEDETKPIPGIPESDSINIKKQEKKPILESKKEVSGEKASNFLDESELNDNENSKVKPKKKSSKMFYILGFLVLLVLAAFGGYGLAHYLAQSKKIDINPPTTVETTPNTDSENTTVEPTDSSPIKSNVAPSDSNGTDASSENNSNRGTSSNSTDSVESNPNSGNYGGGTNSSGNNSDRESSSSDSESVEPTTPSDNNSTDNQETDNSDLVVEDNPPMDYGMEVEDDNDLKDYSLDTYKNRTPNTTVPQYYPPEDEEVQE